MTIKYFKLSITITICCAFISVANSQIIQDSLFTLPYGDEWEIAPKEIIHNFAKPNPKYEVDYMLWTLPDYFPFVILMKEQRVTRFKKSEVLLKRRARSEAPKNSEINIDYNEKHIKMIYSIEDKTNVIYHFLTEDGWLMLFGGGATINFESNFKSFEYLKNNLKIKKPHSYIPPSTKSKYIISGLFLLFLILLYNGFKKP